MPALNALDNYKSDRRRQPRAERALEEIRSIWDGGNVVRDGVTLESIQLSIRRETFPPDYDPDNNDDHILLLLKNYQDQHQGDDVLIATEDGGMELKCRARGIPYVRPDAAQKLQSVSDEAAKEIQRLRQEVESQKARQPEIIIGIADSEKIATVCSVHLGLNREFQTVSIPADRPTDGGYMARITRYELTPEQFETYRQECIEHNQAVEVLSKFIARAFEVQLAVGNMGTSPAHNVDVHIRFPHSIIVLRADSVEAPAPPKKPSWRGSYLDRLDTSAILSMPEVGSVFHNLSYTIEPSGDAVHIKIKELKQHHPEVLKTFVIGFRGEVEPSSFNADCQITANELPQPLEKKLHFSMCAPATDAGGTKA